MSRFTVLNLSGCPNNQIDGKADGGMNTPCCCAEAMSSAGIGLWVTPVGWLWSAAAWRRFVSSRLDATSILRQSSLQQSPFAKRWNCLLERGVKPPQMKAASSRRTPKG